MELANVLRCRLFDLPILSSVFFLLENEQSADAVMARLTSFIATAQTTLEFALYDLCLFGPLMQWLKLALQERAAARVQVRICYDGDKPYVPNLAGGQDPASAGTGAICALVRLPFPAGSAG
ncbi:MAG: hypothetical protein H0X04_10350 [Chthoniobacterales bacterium]|nr:hypothetical protein [Chthoniobacterales bacterium]